MRIPPNYTQLGVVVHDEHAMAFMRKLTDMGAIEIKVQPIAIVGPKAKALNGITGAGIARGQRVPQILEAVKQHGPIGVADLAKIVGGTTGSVGQALYKALKDGLVSRTDGRYSTAERLALPAPPKAKSEKKAKAAKTK